MAETWIKLRKSAGVVEGPGKVVRSRQGIKYLLVRATVPTVDYGSVAALDCSNMGGTKPGPFILLKGTIACVHSEADGKIDADWYITMF